MLFTVVDEDGGKVFMAVSVFVKLSILKFVRGVSMLIVEESQSALF